MTPEIWTIIGVGIALATVIMASNRRLERGLEALMDRMDNRMERDKVELLVRLKGIENQIGALRERMAHSDGLLEGLREAIAHNRAA